MVFCLSGFRPFPHKNVLLRNPEFKKSNFWHFRESNGKNNVIALCVVDGSTTRGKRACSQRHQQNGLTTKGNHRVDLLPSSIGIYHQDTPSLSCSCDRGPPYVRDHNVASATTTTTAMTPLNDSWGNITNDEHSDGSVQAP